MKDIYIYRNTTIEYLFKNKHVSFSGYEEMSEPPEDADIVMLYFIPYQYSRDKILNFIEDYKARVEFVLNRNAQRKIYVVGLHNYFYKSFVFQDNAVNDAIHAFYQFIAGNERICAIDMRDFYRKHSESDLFDSKYYYLYNTIINPKYAGEFEAWLLEEMAVHKKVRKKCLILDLDHTLWGGVVGEDGVENLHISGSYPGNCYHDFQQLILEIKSTGVILCSCSKNNPADVEGCFAKRDDMLVKYSDFTLHSISWESKALQIADMAKQLNIGLDSMVFVDDNPAERELIRTQLPEVTVLEFPEFPYMLVEHFKKDFYKYFGISGLTDDDLDKAEQYRHKLISDELKESIQDEEDFIRELKIRIVCSSMNRYNEQRIEQLIHKTNQFNLTTRRYSLEELKNIQKNQGLICGIKIIDKFGDLGITGVAVIKTEGKKAIIDSLLLSCRILGRKIEYEFLKYILNKLFDAGIREVEAVYKKSNKNEQTKHFYDSLGFEVVTSNEQMTIYLYEMTQKFDYDSKYVLEEENE